MVFSSKVMKENIFRKAENIAWETSFFDWKECYFVLSLSLNLPIQRSKRTMCIKSVERRSASG